jgi:outer membrane lipoprotein-sorting protein
MIYLKRSAILILLVLIISGCGEKPPISNEQLKQKIEERFAYRAQLFIDYTCELVSTRLSDSPRGEMTSEMKFMVYKKMPDKTKSDFVEGKRNGEKISKEDYGNFGRRRPGADREGQRPEGRRAGGDRARGGMGRRMLGGSEQPFDLLKHIQNIKVTGSEMVQEVDTYKLNVKIKDKKDRLEKAIIWLDKETFDIVKFEGTYRKGERIESGELVKTYAPVGPEAAWMLVEQHNDTYMVFDTPMGEFDMESTSTSKYSNYLFNQNLSDSLFVKDK